MRGSHQLHRQEGAPVNTEARHEQAANFVPHFYRSNSTVNSGFQTTYVQIPVEGGMTDWLGYLELHMYLVVHGRQCTRCHPKFGSACHPAARTRQTRPCRFGLRPTTIERLSDSCGWKPS